MMLLRQFLFFYFLILPNACARNGRRRDPMWGRMIDLRNNQEFELSSFLKLRDGTYIILFKHVFSFDIPFKYKLFKINSYGEKIWSKEFSMTSQKGEIFYESFAKLSQSIWDDRSVFITGMSLTKNNISTYWNLKFSSRGENVDYFAPYGPYNGEYILVYPNIYTNFYIRTYKDEKSLLILNNVFSNTEKSIEKILVTRINCETGKVNFQKLLRLKVNNKQIADVHIQSILVGNKKYHLFGYFSLKNETSTNFMMLFQLVISPRKGKIYLEKKYSLHTGYYNTPKSSLFNYNTFALINSEPVGLIGSSVFKFDEEKGIPQWCKIITITEHHHDIVIWNRVFPSRHNNEVLLTGIIPRKNLEVIVLLDGESGEIISSRYFDTSIGKLGNFSSSNRQDKLLRILSPDNKDGYIIQSNLYYKDKKNSFNPNTIFTVNSNLVNEKCGLLVVKKNSKLLNFQSRDCERLEVVFEKSLSIDLDITDFHIPTKYSDLYVEIDDQYSFKKEFVYNDFCDKSIQFKRKKEFIDLTKMKKKNKNKKNDLFLVSILFVLVICLWILVFLFGVIQYRRKTGLR